MNVRELVGQEAVEDYSLKTGEHAKIFETTAPELAAVLKNASLAIESDAFARWDGEAITAQSVYRRFMGAANTCVLIVTALGAASMASAIVWPQFPLLGQAISVTATAFSGIGAFSLYKLREGKMLETWMTARATAETHRISYFHGVGEVARTAQSTTLCALLLEYFRRYQYEVQNAFYINRGKLHQESAGRTLTLGALGAAIALTSSLLAALGTGLWSAFGAMAVVGAALGAYAVGREQMTQDRRNAERYARTAVALATLGKRLDEVRKAASAGNGEAVAEFVNAINEQVSLEHRQWLVGGEGAKAALARLEEALNRSKPETTAHATLT